jgi:hypothetical protein
LSLPFAFSPGVDALLERFEIRKHQFRLDGIDIGNRIDLALDMRDVGVFEATLRRE